MRKIFINQPKKSSFSLSSDEEKIIESIEDSSVDTEKLFHHLQDATQFKYKHIWQRALRKIVIGIRMKKFMNSLTSKTTEDVPNEDIEYFIRSKMRILQSSLTISNPRESTCILSPNSNYKSIWNIYIGLLLLYTAFITTFLIAFVETEPWDVYFIIDIAIDFSFLADLIQTLNTAYYDKYKTLVNSRWLIFKNYLRGWLVVDFVACLPLGLIDYLFLDDEQSGIEFNELIRILRIRQLARLFKFTRLGKLVKHYQTSSFLYDLQEFFEISYSRIRFLTTIFTILLSWHLISCLWYLSAKLEDYPSDSWVVKFGYEDSETFSLYLTCLYWSLTTLTTVGYGDIVATTEFERIVAISWMVAGLYFMSFTVSSLSSMFAELDSHKVEKEKKLELAHKYCEAFHLPKHIRKEIQLNIKNSANLIYNTSKEQRALLDLLSTDLKYEIVKQMHNGIIRKILFFADWHQELLAEVIPHLEKRSYIIDESVFSEGDPASDIYFVITGKFKYIYGEKRTVFKLVARKDWFGDFEVFKRIPRKHTVIAGRDSSLLVLNERLLHQLKSKYPLELKKLKELATERDKKTNMALSEMRAIMEVNSIGDWSLIRTKTNEFLNEMGDESPSKKKEKLKEERKSHIAGLEYVLKMNEDRIDSMEGMIGEDKKKKKEKRNKGTLFPSKKPRFVSFEGFEEIAEKYAINNSDED